MTELVNIKNNSVHWQPYVIADTQTRIFFCNAIIFNNKGTGNVTINDIWLVEPQDSLSLNCDQNETDYTVYKIQFVAGAASNRMQIYVKENSGVQAMVQNRLMSIQAPMDRRKMLKKYIQRHGRGDF